MKLKRFFGVALTLCMLVGTFPQNVFAGDKSFGGRSQVKWDDSSVEKKRNGTVALESGKILKAGEGDKLEDINSSYSVFNQFRFYRGQDYYDGTSKNVQFVYDTTQGDYGAKIGNNKYLYAVYNNSSDRNNYKVDFGAYFSSDLRQLISKGDIEAAVVAETDNYKGTTNKHRGVANLRFYNYSSPIQQEITTPENWYDGTRTVTAGWQKLNTDIRYMMLNLRSSRTGLKKWNGSSVQKVRVFLRDSVGPKVKSSGIESGQFTKQKNVYGSDVNASAIDSEIRFYVQFDEKVKTNDTDKLKLRLTANPSNKTDSAAYDAKYDGASGDKMYFKYKIPDNTDKDTELYVSLTPSKLVNGKACITDIAGNALEDETTGGFSNKASDGTYYTVDDTKTGLHSQQFTDRKFYPYVNESSLNISGVQYKPIAGSMPSEISNNVKKNGKLQYGQDTSFGKNNENAPIFRIVLDDEVAKANIQNGDIKRTKLKLQVYDTNNKKIDGKYVYADLAFARTVGVDNKANEKGIKSDATTELYFRYTPQDVNGVSRYKIDFAGSDDNKGNFVFDDDAIMCGGEKLRNISNMTIDGSRLKIPSQYKDLMPLAKNIIIDTKPPELKDKTIAGGWAKDFNSNAKLVFEDEGGFDLDGAYVSVVYWEGGKKRYLPIKLGKSGNGLQSGKTNNDNISSQKMASVQLPVTTEGNSGTVKLNEIFPQDAYPGDKELYLEYSVKDRAGNELNNYDKKDIRLYLDNTPPTVTGVSERNDGTKAVVKYDVFDKGIGKIDPIIEYRLTNFENATNEDKMIRNDNQEIMVTGKTDSYDTWQVRAFFSDTLGNRDNAGYSSNVFSTALRTFTLSLNDSAENIVSDKHKITFKAEKAPAANAKFEVKYGWKKGATATANDMKSSVTFNSVAELTAFDFASEDIQKKYNGGDLFDGEFTLKTSITMKPDNATQPDLWKSFYFDTAAPTGTIEISGNRDGVNESYMISTSLEDDSGSYKDGAYVSDRNIDFSDGNAPKMTLYIGGEAAETRTLDSVWSWQSFSFYNKYAAQGKYTDATEAWVEVEFKDKFGHASKISSDKMKIDLKAPEVTAVTVEPSGLPRPQCDETAYIINGFDEIKTITASISDNVDDKLDIGYREGGVSKLSRIAAADGSFTVNKPLLCDAGAVYEDGMTKYNYVFDVIDMGGNSAGGNVKFVIDQRAPEIHYTDMSEILNMTNAESKTVELHYSNDSYERPDDIKVDVSGAEVAEHSEPGIIKLKVSENGKVTVKLTDKKGKVGEKSFDVTCFDRSVPNITMTNSTKIPESGAAKYGEMNISVDDNDSLSLLGISITTDEPKDTDFFEDEAASRIIGYNGEGEDAEPIYSENGYFGDDKGNAYAKLRSLNSSEAASGVKAEYKLTYGALPNGTYNVYAKVSDDAGNITKVRIATIDASNENAVANVSYTPDNTPTGGAVSMKVTTDIPTRVLFNRETEENIEIMQAAAMQKRADGYTYVYDGQVKTLSFDEAIAKYNEIRMKYVNNHTDFTDEEKLLVKYDPTDYSYMYEDFLMDKTAVKPIGDILDYLLNDCLCSLGYDPESGGYYIDTEIGYSGYIHQSDYGTEFDELRRVFNSAGFTEMVEGADEETILIDVHFPQADEMIDRKNYPEAFDNYSVPNDVDKEKLTVQMTLDDGTVLYQNPFMPLTFKDDDGNIHDYHSQSMTYDQIIETLTALKRFQVIRAEIMDEIAGKYVSNYTSLNGTTAFATEHTLTFENNIDTNYSLIDEMGRMTDLPIKIDWIDRSKPYVPNENIKFKIGGAEFEGKYTNADKAEVEVSLPDTGVFNEYVLSNIPSGAIADSDSRGFKMTITDNRLIEFDVSNPNGTDTTAYRQVYVVDKFDRQAPEYTILYSPSKPSGGTKVNTDVTVSLDNIKDNRSAVSDISVSAQQYTFTENGDYTFTLTDEAGNKTEIPVTIDYIDKNPTELTVKFKSGDTVLNDSVFELTADEADYKNAKYTYIYNDTKYLKNDIEAIIMYKNIQVGALNITDGGEYTFSYTASNGSVGTVSISGALLDKEAPKTVTEYVYNPSAANSKDSVTAKVTVSDNITAADSIRLISVSGRDNDGNEFAPKDIAKGGSGEYLLTFPNNGFADLVFEDGAGNTTSVGLSVSNLDRTAPRAFISYSTVNPTNSDVVATITFDKLADYQIYEQGSNTPTRDYTGTYSSSIRYIFENNGTKVFKFRDVSGNETEGLIASVSNIDKDKPKLTARVEYNKIVDDNGNLKDMPGAATIVLDAEAPDVLTGGESDTVFIQNSSQSRYHSVMDNGEYIYKYMDAAGNFDALTVTVDGIDRTQPTATDSGNPTEWTNQVPTVTVTPNAKSSGYKTYIVQNGQKLDKVEFSPTKNGTYAFEVADEAGNTGTHNVEVTKVDLDAPIISINRGTRDIYINSGEFDTAQKAEFEDVTAEDEQSGVANGVAVAYDPLFDGKTAGRYPVTFTAADKAGNVTNMTRYIQIIGPNDVFAAINGNILVPGEQVNYLKSDELKLTFVNADKVGNKVSYAFAKGFLTGAQMKGASYKALANPSDTIELKPEQTGMYTLFVQTENRKVLVMYVFIAG